MKNTILLIALSFITLVQIKAQTTLALVDTDMNYSTEIISNTTDDTNVTFAKFKKVETAVIRQLQTEVKYPEIAYQYNVEGIVLIQFTFDGNVKDVKVIQSLGAGCDKAVLQAIQDFPKLYQEMGGEHIKPIKVTVPFVFEM